MLVSAKFNHWHKKSGSYRKILKLILRNWNLLLWNQKCIPTHNFMSRWSNQKRKENSQSGRNEFKPCRWSSNEFKHWKRFKKPFSWVTYSQIWRISRRITKIYKSKKRTPTVRYSDINIHLFHSILKTILLSHLKISKHTYLKKSNTKTIKNI